MIRGRDKKKVHEVLKDISLDIKKGDTVGTFTVYNNDIKIGEYNAVSGLEIERAGFSDYLNDIAVA